MKAKENTDWELVEALLDRLKQLNTQDGELWQFAGTGCTDALVTSAKKLLQEIVKQVGIERVVGVVDYGFDGIFDYQLHKDDFDNFVEVLDNLIKQRSSKNYKEAWNLLKGLAYLLDTSDQFTATISDGCFEMWVSLDDAFRVYLYRIIRAAELGEFVVVYRHDDKQCAYNKEAILKKIPFDMLYGDLKLIEDTIRSMYQLRPRPFVFDIEELDESKRRMTLAEFVKYECDQQLVE